MAAAAPVACRHGALRVGSLTQSEFILAMATQV
jgi:hypothetical protein